MSRRNRKAYQRRNRIANRIVGTLAILGALTAYLIILLSTLRAMGAPL